MLTVATPAQANHLLSSAEGDSPGSSKVHSALAYGRRFQQLPLSAPLFQCVLFLFAAFVVFD